MEPISRHQGLEAFYRADARRGRSGEVDFGSTWRDGVGGGSNWRLAWLEATGEVHAVERSGGLVVVLAERLRRPAVDRALAGWERRHALTWAGAAVAFPRTGEAWTGYVVRGTGDGWRVEHGWVACPVGREDARRLPAPDRTGRGQRHWAAEAMAKDLLDDHLGSPVPCPVAHRFAVEVILRRRARAPLVLKSDEVATWLRESGRVWAERELARD